ncbi:MAG: hypothetical protein LBH77_10560, partial [Tannerella sp.]|nr:hypothetical protein [Tannerella sp.]
ILSRKITDSFFTGKIFNHLFLNLRTHPRWKDILALKIIVCTGGMELAVLESQPSDSEKVRRFKKLPAKTINPIFLCTFIPLKFNTIIYGFNKIGKRLYSGYRRRYIFG